MTNQAASRSALLTLLLLGAWGCAKKERIIIFATGNSQGRIWAGEASGSGEKAGGFAVFKTLYDRETLPKLAVDTGNWFSATREGWLSRGRSTVACLNAVPYAAAAVGLEDLSLSPKELQNLAETSSVPLLASNLYLKTNKKPDYISSSEITAAGGRKIGVFSLLIYSALAPNKPWHLANYKLEKESYEAQKAIKTLRDGGAQLIVAILAVNPKEKTTQKFYRDLLSKLPRIDLVITDDPSVNKPFKADRAWVARAGLGMASAARLELTLDAAGRMTDLSSDEIRLASGKYPEDPAMLKVVDGYRKASQAHFSKRVGFLDAPLPLKENGAYPAADFTADCMRRWARTDAAIIGLKEPAAGFPAGTVTVGDLYSTFPLDSSIVFVKIRGDDLERALAGLQAEDISVSGLRLFLKDGILERVESDKGPLVPGRVYKLAVPDSLVSGRENPLLSSAMEFSNSRRYLREVVGWCFSRQRSFSRPAGGRIVRSGDK